MFQMLGFSILFVVHITVAVLNFFLPDLFDIIEVVRIELWVILVFCYRPCDVLI